MSEPRIIEPPTIYDLTNIYSTAGGSSSSGYLFFTRFNNFDTNTLIDTPIIGEPYKIKDVNDAIYSINNGTTIFSLVNTFLEVENSNHDNTILKGTIPIPIPENNDNFSISYICKVINTAAGQFLNRLQFIDNNNLVYLEIVVNWSRRADNSIHWELWINDSFTYTMYNYTYYDESAFGYTQFAYSTSIVGQNDPHLIRVNYINGDVFVYIDDFIALKIQNVSIPTSCQFRPDVRSFTTVGITEIISRILP